MEPFLFYVLTQNDEKGCHLIGYFSKVLEYLLFAIYENLAVDIDKDCSTGDTQSLAEVLFFLYLYLFIFIPGCALTSIVHPCFSEFENRGFLSACLVWFGRGQRQVQ